MSTTTHPTRPPVPQSQMITGVVAIFVGIVGAVITLTGARLSPTGWLVALGVLLVTIGGVGLLRRRHPTP